MANDAGIDRDIGFVASRQAGIFADPSRITQADGSSRGRGKSFQRVSGLGPIMSKTQVANPCTRPYVLDPMYLIVTRDRSTQPPESRALLGTRWG